MSEESVGLLKGDKEKEEEKASSSRKRTAIEAFEETSDKTRSALLAGEGLEEFTSADGTQDPEPEIREFKEHPLQRGRTRDPEKSTSPDEVDGPTSSSPTQNDVEETLDDKQFLPSIGAPDPPYRADSTSSESPPSGDELSGQSCHVPGTSEYRWSAPGNSEARDLMRCHGEGKNLQTLSGYQWSGSSGKEGRVQAIEEDLNHSFSITGVKSDTQSCSEEQPTSVRNDPKNQIMDGRDANEAAHLTGTGDGVHESWLNPSGKLNSLDLDNEMTRPLSAICDEDMTSIHNFFGKSSTSERAQRSLGQKLDSSDDDREDDVEEYNRSTSNLPDKCNFDVSFEGSESSEESILLFEVIKDECGAKRFVQVDPDGSYTIDDEGLISIKKLILKEDLLRSTMSDPELSRNVSPIEVCLSPLSDPGESKRNDRFWWPNDGRSSSFKAGRFQQLQLNSNPKCLSYLMNEEKHSDLFPCSSRTFSKEFDFERWKYSRRRQRDNEENHNKWCEYRTHKCDETFGSSKRLNGTVSDYEDGNQSDFDSDVDGEDGEAKGGSVHGRRTDFGGEEAFCDLGDGEDDDEDILTDEWETDDDVEDVFVKDDTFSDESDEEEGDEDEDDGEEDVSEGEYPYDRLAAKIDGKEDDYSSDESEENLSDLSYSQFYDDEQEDERDDNDYHKLIDERAECVNVLPQFADSIGEVCGREQVLNFLQGAFVDDFSGAKNWFQNEQRFNAEEKISKERMEEIHHAIEHMESGYESQENVGHNRFRNYGLHNHGDFATHDHSKENKCSVPVLPDQVHEVPPIDERIFEGSLAVDAHLEPNAAITEGRNVADAREEQTAFEMSVEEVSDDGSEFVRRLNERRIAQELRTYEVEMRRFADFAQFEAKRQEYVEQVEEEIAQIHRDEARANIDRKKKKKEEHRKRLEMKLEDEEGVSEEYRYRKMIRRIKWKSDQIQQHNFQLRNRLLQIKKQVGSQKRLKRVLFHELSKAGDDFRDVRQKVRLGTIGGRAETLRWREFEEEEQDSDEGGKAPTTNFDYSDFDFDDDYEEDDEMELDIVLSEASSGGSSLRDSSLGFERRVNEPRHKKRKVEVESESEDDEEESEEQEYEDGDYEEETEVKVELEDDEEEDDDVDDEVESALSDEQEKFGSNWELEDQDDVKVDVCSQETTRLSSSTRNNSNKSTAVVQTKGRSKRSGVNNTRSFSTEELTDESDEADRSARISSEDPSAAEGTNNFVNPSSSRRTRKKTTGEKCSKMEAESTDQEPADRLTKSSSLEEVEVPASSSKKEHKKSTTSRRSARAPRNSHLNVVDDYSLYPLPTLTLRPVQHAHGTRAASAQAAAKAASSANTADAIGSGDSRPTVAACRQEMTNSTPTADEESRRSTFNENPEDFIPGKRKREGDSAEPDDDDLHLKRLRSDQQFPDDDKYYFD